MRSPLARNAITAAIPASIGGWNARDALYGMAATDAVVLDNMIPGPGGVAMRGGSVVYATGLGAPVNALLRYNPPGAVQRLFGCAGANVYDVTAPGAVGTAVLSGQTGDKWRGAMFGTPGGSFLMAANGTDAPQKYDGSTWSAIALVAPQPRTYQGSGGAQVAYSYPYTLTPSKLMNPVVFGQRVWFVEKGSLRVWFLPINAIGSSAQNDPVSPSTVPDLSPCAQALDFASQCKLGGTLVAMAVWTRDGGTGSDDYAIFITSAGEVLVYAGTDPTSATSWSRVGVFRVAPPVGDRPTIAAGADVAVLTETGLLPLSSVLALDPSQDEQSAITDKIRGAFQSAYQSAATAYGWAPQDYPMGALLVINVPNADGVTFRQFVMNLLTQAWCSFSGLPAICWGLLGDRLMFGTPDGRVCQYDVGSADTLMPAVAPIAQPVKFTCLPAFSAFKTAGRKRFTMARPLYTSALGYRAPIALRVDYDTTALPLPQPAIPSSATPWGSPWGSPWGPVVKPVTQWSGLRGLGLVGTILVSGASLNPFRLDKIDVQFETGDSF